MEFSWPGSKEIAVVVAAYLLGCVSVGYYLVKFRTGQDIRSLGSGAAGSSNVARALGPAGFVVTLLGDAAKGVVTAWGATYFGLQAWFVMAAILAVVAGQIWPVQLGFRGGKGLGPALGAMLVFNYTIVVFVVVASLLFMAVVKRRTQSGLAAVAVTPAYVVISGQPQLNVIGITVLVVIVLIAHRDNIRDMVLEAHRPPGGRA